MHHIDLKESTHVWEKQNLVTTKGHYDEMKCKLCGMIGRRYNLAQLRIDGRHSAESATYCPKAPKKEAPKTITITNCAAFGDDFTNLTPNSVHNVVTPPPPHKNDNKGIWVIGAKGAPVKVLNSEYTIINQ